MISEPEIRIVRAMVAEKISLISLCDDLTDHLCCSIDDHMNAGADFETALTASLTELAPDGLEKVQRDTLWLSKHLNLLYMKKVMYSLGLLGAMGISMGLMFKLLHLPGGGQIFNTGFVFFAFGYLPMKAYQYFTNVENLTLLKKWMVLAMAISVTLVAGAIYCRLIIHIPAATMLLMTGVSVFSFAFLPLLFLDLYKRSVAQG